MVLEGLRPVWLAGQLLQGFKAIVLISEIRFVESAEARLVSWKNLTPIVSNIFTNGSFRSWGCVSVGTVFICLLCLKPGI